MEGVSLTGNEEAVVVERDEDTRGRRARKTIPQTQRLICDECGLLFAKHRDFLEHMAIFHDAKEPGRFYACGECAQLFHTAEERRLHDADHDAALIIDRAERSRRLRRTLRTPRAPLSPTALSANPPPPVSTKSQVSSLSQPLRLEIEPNRGPSEPPSSAARTMAYGTISAPATPQSSWSPSTATHSTGAPPPVKRTKAPGSAPITPSEMLFNPPPPEPSPVGRKAGPWPPSRCLPEPTPSTTAPPTTHPAGPKPGTGPPSGSWSKCPRCQTGFASAWLMLEHAIEAHGARLVRLERKCFDEAMIEKRCEVYEGVGGCPFCALQITVPSDCLLHIVQEHRSNTGLYESPDWAHRVVVTAEVVYTSPQQEPTRELKFKINVTLKVRK